MDFGFERMDVGFRFRVLSIGNSNFRFGSLDLRCGVGIVRFEMLCLRLWNWTFGLAICI